MVMQCSKAATARKDRDIHHFRFIAVASRGYKNWLQFEQHYSHSVFNFYFFGKTIRRQMSSKVLKLDLNSTWWMPKLVSINQSYAALMSQSLRTIIGPLQDSWHLFHYVIGISGMLPYNRNVTSQTLELFSACTFARLDNAAAPPASRLRSAGSLAITGVMGYWQPCNLWWQTSLKIILVCVVPLMITSIAAQFSIFVWFTMNTCTLSETLYWSLWS